MVATRSAVTSMEVFPRPKGCVVAPRPTSSTLDLSALATKDMWDSLTLRMTEYSPAATPVRMTTRPLLALKELDLIHGATDMTFVAIIGVMHMVMNVRSLPIRGGLATSAIALRLTVGRMGRTFARTVSAVAPAGPAAPSAPVAVRTTVTRVGIPTLSPITS